MTRTLAFGFVIGFLVILVLVTVISLRPIAWTCTRVKASSALSMPHPRALNLQAHFGTLRRLASSPTRSTFSGISEESEDSHEKIAVKREVAATYAQTPQVHSTIVLSMLAAVPGHILALISSPVPLSSRPATIPTGSTIHLSLPHDEELHRPARTLPVIHKRCGAISLVRPPPPKSVRERPDSLQTTDESPSIYSQVTTVAPDDVPTIMVSVPSCPTLELSEVEGREGGMLGPRGYYF